MSLKRISAYSHCSYLSAIAQRSKGIVAGTMRDRSGAIVSGAKSGGMSQETGEAVAAHSMTTELSALRPLTPVTTRISVQAEALRCPTVRNLNVSPSIVTTCDRVLTIGGACARESAAQFPTLSNLNCRNL